MRNNTISIAKAFGIILMVIGHASCPTLLHNFIYQFHMPLFFFFSGYCFKDKYLDDFKTYSIRRVKGIYIPYVKYALLFLLLHNVFFHLNIYNDAYGYMGSVSQLYSHHDFIRRVIKITTSMSYEEQLLGGYWFMKILFITSFLGYAFYKFLHSAKARYLGIGLLISGTVALSFSEEFSDFWYSIYLSCHAAIYFIAGKEFSSLKIPQNWWFTLICLIGVIAISVIHPAPIGFTAQKYLLLYVIGALFGILFTHNVSKHIQKLPKVSQALTYIGNNTLTILTWHFISFKLVSLLIIYIYKLPIEQLATFPVITEYAKSGWWIAYTLIGVALPICMLLLTEPVMKGIKEKFLSRKSVQEPQS